MRIDLDVDTKELFLRMRNGERRLAFGVVSAINDTLRRIQDVERAAVEDRFEVRKKTFIRQQAAVIKPFASVKQARPYGEIGVGQKPRLLLSVFERGGERKPFTPGARRVAIPVKGSPARPTFASPVPAELQFKALRFRRTRPLASLGRTKSGRIRRSKKKASGILYGERGTYLIPKYGVFQRKAAGRARRLLYWFKSGSRLKPRLKFVETAQRFGRPWFREAMQRKAIEALARSGGALR